MPLKDNSEIELETNENSNVCEAFIQSLQDISSPEKIKERQEELSKQITEKLLGTLTLVSLSLN